MRPSLRSIGRSPLPKFGGIVETVPPIARCWSATSRLSCPTGAAPPYPRAGRRRARRDAPAGPLLDRSGRVWRPVRRTILTRRRGARPAPRGGDRRPRRQPSTSYTSSASIPARPISAACRNACTFHAARSRIRAWPPAASPSAACRRASPRSPFPTGWHILGRIARAPVRGGPCGAVPVQAGRPHPLPSHRRRRIPRPGGGGGIGRTGRVRARPAPDGPAASGRRANPVRHPAGRRPRRVATLRRVPLRRHGHRSVGDRRTRWSAMPRTPPRSNSPTPAASGRWPPPVPALP